MTKDKDNKNYYKAEFITKTLINSGLKKSKLVTEGENIEGVCRWSWKETVGIGHSFGVGGRFTKNGCCLLEIAKWVLTGNCVTNDCNLHVHLKFVIETSNWLHSGYGESAEI